MLGILLAAGKGTRMKNPTSKLLFDVSGEPLCFASFKALYEVCDRVLVVIGHKGPEVQRRILERAEELYGHSEVKAKTFFYTQEKQLGTGHAVRTALESNVVSGYQSSHCLILNGDLPLITAATLRDFANVCQDQDLSSACLSFLAENPKGLGRIVRNAESELLRIVEEKDASEEERRIHEVNSGVYAFNLKALSGHIHKLDSSNEQNEIYLTDMFDSSAEGAADRKAEALLCDSGDELLGVNTTYELGQVRTLSQRRLKKDLCENFGVEFENIDSCFVSARAKFKGHAYIGQGVQIEGATVIGAGVSIEGQALVRECELDDGANILWGSVLQNARVGSEAKVGPMAHLRPGTQLGPKVKVGNFVEIKNSVFSEGAKASHLSYLGDAVVGREANIGAGTITCNYDGFSKFQTTIGERTFIGSDSQLVAPVEVGDGAYVGSGTTVTEDVPPGALAISRPDMIIKEGYAAKLQAKLQAKLSQKSKSTEDDA